MASTSVGTRNVKRVELPDSSSMFTSSDPEYHTALASEQASTSSSLFSDPVRSEGMMERTEGGKCLSIEEQIERSKCHWSEMVKFDSDDEEVAGESNVEVFKTLKMHLTRGFFFRTFGEGEDSWGELVVGEKFAEGGQAELYEAKVTWKNPKANEWDLEHGIEWVLKVFKKGTFLRHLQSMLPHGYLNWDAEWVEQSRSGTWKPFTRYFCHVHCGILLEDGRFAFLMQREHEDLRRLIDRRMTLRTGNDNGPFPKEDAEALMYEVAVGMEWLHSHNIVHRDLKASNVLFTQGQEGGACYVADFECSIGVVGTGFFRAPEILQACKDKTVSKKPELFTKATDVYGYGMTCYEILTGKLPFEGHEVWDFGHVLKGQRPEVPEYVDDWTRELVSRCWQSNPIDRPSFEEILNVLRTNSAEVRDIELVWQQQS